MRGSLSKFVLGAAAVVLAVGAGAVVSIDATADPAHRPLRVMAMGDSITQGFDTPKLNGGPQAWRYWFWQDRASLGCGDIDMVGEFNTLFQTGQLPDGVDQDHEARSGAQTDYLRSRVKYNKAIEIGQPDVVLMLLGTNDLFNYNEPRDTPEQVRDQMTALIDEIRAKKPDVAFLLMGVNPRGTPYLDRIVATNGYYQQIAASRDTPTSPIEYVDGYSGFDPKVDTFDGIHPSASGQHKISDRFHNSLAAYCAANTSTTTSSTTTSSTTTTRPTTTTTSTSTTTTPTTAPTTTTTQLPSQPARLEAEAAQWSTGVKIDTAWCPCSGGAALGDFREPGEYVQWSLASPTARTVTLTWRYGAGGGATSRQLLVNGTAVKTVQFPATSGWAGWTTVSTTVQLPAGTSSVRLASTSWGAYLNVDYVERT